MLRFDSDIDGVVRGIPEVFDSVLEGREPPGIARLGKYFLSPPIFIGEAEMPGREDDDHASHMRVQARLLVGSVVDVHDLYVLILKSQLVVRGLNLDRV